jgi:uncharacterized protein YoaH (UPF0181 family)
VGFLSKAMKSGVALKVAQVAIREARKPENQRKAKEFVQKIQAKRKPGA